MFKTMIFSIITIFAIGACSNTGNKKLNLPHQRDTNIPLVKTTNTNSISNSSNYNDGSYKMLAYINSIRARGTKCAPPAPPLYSNSSLERAAIAHSKDMAINHFLKHNGSGTEIDVARPRDAQYSNFADRIAYYGYPVKPNLLVGENITFTLLNKRKDSDFSYYYKRAVDNWLHNEARCKILMNPRFKYAGIGYQKTKDRYYFTLDLAEKNVAK